MSEVWAGEFDMEDDFICWRLIEADAWRNAKDPIIGTIFNYFDECLTARYEPPDHVNAVFVDTGSDHPAQDQKIFSLEKYKTTNPSHNISVAFSVSVNEHKYHMCCTREKEITFKKGLCPDKIDGDFSEVIFFAGSFSSGHDAYKFESSLHRDHFLAIKEENGRRILHLKKPAEEVDEQIMFNLNNT